MAESVQLPATGTGTADIKVAADAIGGEQYQRVKIAMGIDGTFDKDVSATDPLPITVASGKIASGAVASGAIASGAVASGAVASGAVADGAIVTLGAKADDKSTATDTTAITAMQVLKELSFVSQAVNTKLTTGTVIGDVNLGATDNAVLDGLETHLHSIDGKLVTGTVIGDVNLGATDNAVLDGLETHLHSIDGKLVTGTVIGDVNLGATDNAVLDTIDAAIDEVNVHIHSIDGKLVTGTVIGDVNLGATDNAVLDGLETHLHSIDGKLVTGTVIGDVNLGATDNAVLDTMVTALQVIDNMISGSEAQVDVITMPTVTVNAHAVTVASGGIASGAVAAGAIAAGAIVSGAILSGAVASGAISSGAIASGAVASGAVASGAIATGAIVDALADDAAFSIATSRVFPMGCLADETSPDSVDEGDVGVPRMTLDRKQLMVCAPSITSDGLLASVQIDIDETEDEIIATAAKLYGYYFYNNTAATIYVRFYNLTAANTTVGTSTTFIILPVPAGAAANLMMPIGITFGTAMCVAATTGVAANDTGAPAANAIVGTIFYKG